MLKSVTSKALVKFDDFVRYNQFIVVLLLSLSLEQHVDLGMQRSQGGPWRLGPRVLFKLYFWFGFELHGGLLDVFRLKFAHRVVKKIQV